VFHVQQALIPSFQHDPAASLLHFALVSAKLISPLVFQTRKPNKGCGRKNTDAIEGQIQSGAYKPHGKRGAAKFERDTTWSEGEWPEKFQKPCEYCAAEKQALAGAGVKHPKNWIEQKPKPDTHLRWREETGRKAEPEPVTSDCRGRHDRRRDLHHHHGHRDRRHGRRLHHRHRSRRGHRRHPNARFGDVPR
jgi:hypothetical protein